jgi:hypothetical protein
LELKDWVTVFENAKRHAFRSSNDLSSSAAAAVITHKEIEDEQNVPTGEGEHDTNKPSIEGYKIDDNSTSDLKVTPPLATISPSSSQETKRNNSNPLTKKRATSVSNLPSSRPQLTHHSHSASSKESTTTLTSVTTDDNAITTPSSTTQISNEKSSSSANQQNFWGTLQWAMPAMNLIMNTVNVSEGDDDPTSVRGKGGRLRSGSGPVGFGADGSIAEYPQSLSLHNAQLHLLFPSATDVEFVLDSK